jgi:hypothetical protein
LNLKQNHRPALSQDLFELQHRICMLYRVAILRVFSFEHKYFCFDPTMEQQYVIISFLAYYLR